MTHPISLTIDNVQCRLRFLCWFAAFLTLASLYDAIFRFGRRRQMYEYTAHAWLPISNQSITVSFQFANPYARAAEISCRTNTTNGKSASSEESQHWSLS